MRYLENIIMETHHSFKGWSYNDIIFFRRNQSYGAYALRKASSKNTLFALLLMLLSGGISIGVSKFMMQLIPASIPEKEIVLTPSALDVVKVIRPKLNPVIKAAGMVKRHDLEYHVVTNQAIPERETAPTTESVNNSAVATDAGTGVASNDAGSSLTALEAQPAVMEASNELFTVVEKMPEFPGGYEALYRFVSENFQIPRQALENGEHGTMLATLIINQDGSVEVGEFRKSISSALNREAARVLKMLPRFKPGIQQGRPVRVVLTLPIKVKGES